VCVETRRRNPQQFYGLAAWNEIAFINVSVNEEQAKTGVFEAIKGAVRASPYFQSLKPRIGTLIIQFPGRIELHCGHSGATSKLGFQTLRGFIDEANKMRDSGGKSNAQELFHMLAGSMQTRYPNHYKLIMASSFSGVGTFLHSQVKEIKQAGTPYVARVRGLTLSDARRLASGHLAARVTAPAGCTDEELARTLALSHRLVVAAAGPWTQTPDGWSRTVEVYGEGAKALR
jgi:hypothetical protein